jgi:hypothetical protein
MPRINGLIDPITVVGTRGDDDTTKPQQLNRVTEILTVTDDDSTSFTLAAEDIKKGINIHTSVTGAGTVTVDTAANIISKIPLTADGQSIVSYYINDGNQTATFAVATGTTIADVGNTVLTNEAAVLLWRRTSSTAVVLYIVSS